MEEICIGGGGVRGIAFLGALHELHIKGFLKNIKVYSGASIGGLFALLLIIGYTPEEIINVFFNKDLKSLKDTDIKGLFNHKSIMKGKIIKDFIFNLINRKENPYLTLKELYNKTNKKLIIAVTCVSTGKVEYKSYESDPEMSLLTLMYMTTAIPFIFPPVIYDNKFYADGGILDNFPKKILKTESMGIIAISDHTEENSFSFLGYIIKILSIIYNKLQNDIVEQQNNVIKINTKHVKVTSFDISCDEKLMLIKNGIQSAKDFINNH